MKADIPKDISLAEACKYGSLTDFAFFDKVSWLIKPLHTAALVQFHEHESFCEIDCLL